MRTEYHHWYSGRTSREMGVVVYGHWGPPMLVFPTSGGDEWEMDRQGMIAALADFIDGGRVKVFTVNANSGDAFYNKGAHPFHRSYMQAQYDAYVRYEVVPFIRQHCQSDDDRRSPRWARRSARTTRPTRSSSTRTCSGAATPSRACTT